ELDDLAALLFALCLNLVQCGLQASVVDQHGHDESHGKYAEQSEQTGDERPASAPAISAFGSAHRPRLDWLTLLEPVQIVGQLRGGGIATPRRLLQALQANGDQIARQARPEYYGRQGLVTDQTQHGLDGVVGVKWRPADKHLIENRTQGVD